MTATARKPLYLLHKAMPSTGLDVYNATYVIFSKSQSISFFNNNSWKYMIKKLGSFNTNVKI